MSSSQSEPLSNTVATPVTDLNSMQPMNELRERPKSSRGTITGLYLRDRLLGPLAQSNDASSTEVVKDSRVSDTHLGGGAIASALIVAVYVSTWSFRNVFVQFTSHQVPYSTYGNVLAQELIKTFAAMLAYTHIEQEGVQHGLKGLLRVEVKSLLLYVVPAVLYMINNQGVFIVVEMVFLPSCPRVH